MSDRRRPSMSVYSVMIERGRISLLSSFLPLARSFALIPRRKRKRASEKRTESEDAEASRLARSLAMQMRPGGPPFKTLEPFEGWRTKKRARRREMDEEFLSSDVPLRGITDVVTGRPENQISLSLSTSLLFSQTWLRLPYFSTPIYISVTMC